MISKVIVAKTQGNLGTQGTLNTQGIQGTQGTLGTLNTQGTLSTPKQQYFTRQKNSFYQNKSQ